MSLPTASSASHIPPSPSTPPSPLSPTSSPSTLLLRATFAHHAERYDDLYDLLKQLIDCHPSPLPLLPRSLFCLATKHVLAPLRASWRILITRETSEQPAVPSEQLAALTAYRLQVQGELHARVEDVVRVVGTQLLPALHGRLVREVGVLLLELVGRWGGGRGGGVGGGGGGGGGVGAGGAGGGGGGEGEGVGGQSEAVEEEVRAALSTLNAKLGFVQTLTEEAAAVAEGAVSSSSSLVLYYKMLGDLRRYQAELSPSSERVRSLHSLHAHVAYSVAASLASLLQLPPHSPEVLALALNRAVFEYEVMMQPERAMRIAKEAYDSAVGGQGGGRGEGGGEGEEEGEGGDGYGDSEVIKRLLKQNLTLWSSLT